MSEWKKVKIGDVCEIIKGATGIASAEPGEYPLVVTAVERKTCSSFQFDCEAVCIPLVSSSGHGKKSLNNVHYQKGKFALGTILCAVVPNNPNELDARFLHQYLQFYKDKILVPLMKGAANVSLSMKDIAKVEIPLPSIEKQHELSELFVETQKKYKELLEESEKQKSYVKQLRQNILQEAIEGKLTEEWRKENPVVKGNPDFDAEALFEKIQEEKCHTDSELLRNSKKKVFELIAENEVPFEIPEGWKWVRLGEICNKIGSGSTPSGSDYCESGIPFFRSQNVYNDGLVYKDIVFISHSMQNKMNGTRVFPNDLLLNITGGSLGRCAIVPENFKEGNVSQHVCIIRPLQTSPLYLHIFILSEMFQKNVKTSGAGRQGLPKYNLEKMIISLPPLTEQKEIVSRVEKLLANVTELEKQIKERETLTKQLMQSILKDAFREV